jgi:hypothetical protein
LIIHLGGSFSRVDDALWVYARSSAACFAIGRAAPRRRGWGDGHDVNVTTTRAAANVKLLQQLFESRLVSLGDADEEQDAAALACAALGKGEQTLMTAAASEITAEDRFAIGNSAAHRVDANDLGAGNGPS